jgi:hypothetical protein
MLRLYKYILIIAIVISSSYTYGDVLDFPECIQEQDQWCWAATTQCVLQYYGDNDITQCEIANFAWENADSSFRSCSDNCCDSPDGCCNYWNYLWWNDADGNPAYIKGTVMHILKSASSVASVESKLTESSVSQTTVQNAIDDGRPVYIRVNSGGHFIVLYGLDGDTLYYMDPWTGEGKKYQDFSTSAVNGREWTHTMELTTQPDTTKRIDLQAVVDNNGVKLTWTLNNITPRAQEIYRDTDSDPNGRGRIGWTRNGSEFVDSEVTPGTTYYYWIKATEADGTVTNSTAVSAAVTN